MKHPFTVAALLLLPCTGTHADTLSDALGTIDAAMPDVLQKNFGGVILIEQKGKPIFEKSYGFADRENKISFTPDTVAQIGSLTKSMTAFAILSLAREGKVDIEKPVKTYLPGAADPAGSATIHQILTHHAGLMDTCGDDFDALSKADLLARCMASPFAHPAGEDHYSNMGYSILAAVVEQVSGKSWEDYLREHLWRPLGMNRTGFTQFAGVSAAQFAYGYPPGQKRQDLISNSLAKLKGDDWNLRGNGGIQSTVVDMERFYRGLNGTLPGIPRDVANAIMSAHDHIDGEAWRSYGLPVRLDKNGRPYRIGFAGSDGTFEAYFGMLPQQDFFIYVVGNNGEDNVKPVISAALKAALKIAGITQDMLQPATK